MCKVPKVEMDETSLKTSLEELKYSIRSIEMFTND